MSLYPVIRLVGVVFFAAGLIAFANDLWLWDGQNQFTMRSLGEWWFRISPGGINLTQAVIQRYIWPTLWDPLILNLLEEPAAAVLGLPGLAILFLVRRQPHR